MKSVLPLVCAAVVLLVVLAFGARRAQAQAATPAAAPVASKQLEKLSRDLKQKTLVSVSSRAYTQLSALASGGAASVTAARAALALGFFDYTKGNYAQAAKWFARAQGDTLLCDYALFWSAQTNLALGQSADALAQFEKFRKAYPDSVMTEQALQSLGNAALAASQPAEAVAALDSYSLTPQRPALLFLRGEAHELAGDLPAAAADYQSVYLRFAASDQGRQASVKLESLQSGASAKIPPLSRDDRLSHADVLFNAKSWSLSRNEYAALLPQLSGAASERAQARILEAGLSLGADPSELVSLHITDPEVDAARFASLAEYYRDKGLESQMVAAVEAAVARAPVSASAESALFVAGNYYYVQLDRDRAAGFYRRLKDSFPSSPDADPAQWRVALASVLKRQQDAVDLLQQHLRDFPGSAFTPDALYWLGRFAEEANNAPLARGYYAKLIDRYANHYFSILAAERVKMLGPGDKDSPDILATIPPIPVAPELAAKIPPAGAAREARSLALRSISFEPSAELELRAGYAATGEPRFLLEAAKADVADGRFGPAMVTIRQIYPQLESHPLAELPREAWLAAYGLPFLNSIRHWSAVQHLDPMLVAGLIHQESVFEPEARSVSNALGLMQLLPSTARQLAKEGKIRYSQARLFDADYNIRLGTAYFAELRQRLGSVEAALAAYNAGENRVAFWTMGQNYREMAEFVDAIPFTQTRQYVQIITRNADIYRQLYGAKSESPTVPKRPRR